MKINGEFESMEEAFSFCRERDCPVIAQVAGQRYRLFPSGRTDRLITFTCPSCKTVFGFKDWEKHLESKVCAYGRTTVLGVL